MPHDCAAEEAALLFAEEEVAQKELELDVAQSAMEAAELELMVCQEH